MAPRASVFEAADTWTNAVYTILLTWGLPCLGPWGGACSYTQSATGSPHVGPCTRRKLISIKMNARGRPGCACGPVMGKIFIVGALSITKPVSVA